MNIIDVTIANGEAISTAKDIPEGETICAISNAGGFTGATLTIEISFNGGTNWLPVMAVNSTTAFAVAMANSARYVPIPPEVFLAAHQGYQCKVRLTSASNEGDVRVLRIHTRKIH